VVDDERDMAESCGYFLNRAGFEVSLAFSGEEALDVLDRKPCSLVITDLKMPRMSGLELLRAIKSRDPDIDVLLITGYPEIGTAVEAIKRGAFDYVPKPFEERDLMGLVHKAIAHRGVKDGNTALRERLRKGAGGRQLIYRSKVFEEVVQNLRRVAATDASVLIQGESGTGKELLAHFLHDNSPRAGRPFVPVDCGAIPENLVESELFGHKKGAFSGAHADKVGLFQVADGGTLFMDEVGELPLSFQATLLRTIQERQVRPVGASGYQDVDVRLVCATNRNLQEEVKSGRFRQDLYYRLDVVRLEAPPLRARVEDVPVLARQFLAEFIENNPNCSVRDLSPEVLVVLQEYHWPGNVRQLRNAVERACTLGKGELIEAGDLPQEVCGKATATVSRQSGDRDVSETFQEMKQRRVAALESSYLEELLRKHGGNVTRSAADAGMSRSAFQKLMQRYGIKSSDFRK
jgi:DNA-binding NtrC family response regulator